MSPTVLREGAYRLFFFSRVEAWPDLHVAHPDGEAKFWLDPEMEEATLIGLSAHQMGEALDIVTRHEQEVRNA